MKIFLLCGVIWTLFSIASSEKRVVCYWFSFSSENEGLKGQFGVENIDPTICTHIIYNYLRVTQNIKYVVDYEEETIRKFINLKNKNPDVKLLIGVGGPHQGSQIPSKIASIATERDDFAKKIREFVDNFNFDGCDYDWQWPGQGIGATDQDKENYVKILENLNKVMKNGKILSISVASKAEDVDKSYDIKKIFNYVDFINLHTYDFHGLQDESLTAFHSPYQKNPNDNSPQAEWNTVSIVKNWISKGCPAEKLTLGIPTYGRSFTLTDINLRGVGAPVNGLGTKSEYLTERKNIIPYAEICYNIKSNNRWVSFWNDAQFAPYAVNNANQWIGYDNLISVAAKIHLAVDNNLGGLNYATIDKDDFSGDCGEGSKFPLIRMGYFAMIKNIKPPNPTLKEGTTAEEPDTTTESTPKQTISKIPDRGEESTTETIKTTTKKPATTTKRTTTISIPTPPYTIVSTSKQTISKIPDEGQESTTETVKTTSKKPASTSKLTAASPIPTPQYTIASSSNKEILTISDDIDEITTVKSKSPLGTPNFSRQKREINNHERLTTDFEASSSTMTRNNAENFPIASSHGNKEERSAGILNGKISSIFTCPEKNGKFKNPDDCCSYIICSDHQPFVFFCSTNFYYNDFYKNCDYQTTRLSTH